MPRPTTLIAASSLSLSLLLAGCATDSGASDDCIRAFRSAEPRAGAPYDESTLDDAVRDCGSVAEWRAAWDRVPSAHPAGTDPIEFLVDRCVEPDLAATALCREVSTAS